MKQETKQKIIKKSPLIFSLCAIAGVVTTTYFAIKDTNRAMDKVSKKEEELDSTLDQKEVIKESLPCYIPTGISASVTILCIIGSHSTNRYLIRSLIGACTVAQSGYEKYQKAVRNRFGDDAHEQILEDIVVEKTDPIEITTSDFCRQTSLDFDEPESLAIFYDSYIERYFEATFSQILQAEYHLNRNFALGMSVTEADFQEFLGLIPLDGDELLGWDWIYEDGLGWIDFNHSKRKLKDGRTCYVIETVYPPKLQM